MAGHVQACIRMLPCSSAHFRHGAAAENCAHAAGQSTSRVGTCVLMCMMQHASGSDKHAPWSERCHTVNTQM